MFKTRRQWRKHINVVGARNVDAVRIINDWEDSDLLFQKEIAKLKKLADDVNIAFKTLRKEFCND